MNHADHPWTPAADIAEAVGNATTTATQITAAAIETITEKDQEIRAFTTLWPRTAERCAARVDRAVAEGTHLPLAGVPLAVKATEGARSHQSRLLIAAGCVPVGATSVPGPGTPWRTS